MRDTNPLTSCKHQGASFTHLTEDPNKRGNIPTNRQEVKRLFIQPAINKNATVNAENATVNSNDTIDRLIAKAAKQRDKLTANRISILRLMVENPYITKEEMASIIGLSGSTIMRNIEFMRGKYLRRVGSDKSGFWEIIE